MDFRDFTCGIESIVSGIDWMEVLKLFLDFFSSVFGWVIVLIAIIMFRRGIRKLLKGLAEFFPRVEEVGL
jgi:hypothetical protein